MDTRVQNFSPNIHEQNPTYSTSHFAINCSSWWNSHDEQPPQSVPKQFIFKGESSSQLCHKAKHLGLQGQDQDSSSTQSSGQSHHEVSNMAGTNSRDHFILSEFAPDTDGKHVEGQMKPVFYIGHPDFSTIPSLIDPSRSMNRIFYPYSDPYSGGLFAAYGPPAIIPQQMLGITPGKVPLPSDLAEDGPIYVNPKQYRAILRRRQMRAKLEAQNKAAKSRKPYLHESRHLHAQNRVRGSGGRFLSKKSDQKPNPTPPTDSHYIPKSLPSSRDGVPLKFEPESRKCGATSIPSCSGITSVTNSDIIFWQPDNGFSATSHGACHCAPFVR